MMLNMGIKNISRISIMRKTFLLEIFFGLLIIGLVKGLMNKIEIYSLEKQKDINKQPKTQNLSVYGIM